MLKQILCLSFALLAFVSCQVGPAYRPPCVKVPEEWKAEAVVTEEIEDVGCWWEIFHDPVLNELEEKAILNNQDINQAIGRVKEEWAQAGVTEADLYPQLQATPGYIDIGFPVMPIGPVIPGVPTPPIRVKEYLAPLYFSYQIDFWLKNWDNYQSAYAHAQAQNEDLRNVLLTVTTDVAQNYFQLRSYDQQLITLEEAIKVRKDAVEINTERFRAGLVSYTDVVQAQAELYSAIASRIDVERQRAESENLVALLIGDVASEFFLPPNPLKDPPPTIPAGLPSELLLRRPDIAKAEREMASRNANIGVAVASFFPSMTLTGQAGYLHPHLKNLFRSLNRYWLLQEQIAQILFDGGRLYEQYLAAKAQYDEAIATYRQSVLAGFRDVENALVDIKQRAEQKEALTLRVKYSQESADLSQERYLTGLVTYLEVTVELQNLLAAQINEEQVLAFEYQATIQLIKALGGSW